MELIFVYNAKSDKVNMLIDFAHKVISPSTYSCDLCSLTHSNFGEKKEWKDFVKESDVKLKFYHIDDFEAKFRLKHDYPIILKRNSEGLSVFLESDEISDLKDVVNLIGLIKGNT